MEIGLKDKVVVITGGSAGIGRAVSFAFSKEGCKVAVCGRNKDKLNKLKKDFGDSSLFIKSVDVAYVGQIKSFAEDVQRAFGRIDIWVNNAGISDPMPFTNTSEEAFDRLININLKSVFYSCMISSEIMKKTGGGVIINTSSFASVIPTAGKALYGATKAAVNSLTRSLAAELAADNIRVVSVIPGYIQTDMTRENIANNKDWLISNITANRLGKPEDMVGAYLFLASKAAEYITGVCLEVSGGKLCVQNPMWSWNRKV